MRVSRRNKSLLVKIGYKELNEMDHFKYLGNVLTRNGYRTREIEMGTAIAKKHLTEKYIS